MNLKETREHYRLKQTDMARMMGVTVRWYQALETGTKKIPQFRIELLNYKLKELTEKWMTLNEQI